VSHEAPDLPWFLWEAVEAGAGPDSWLAEIAAHRDRRRRRAADPCADRQRQPGAPQAARLPEGTWDATVWDAPSFFEWRQKGYGVTSVAGHRVEALGEGRARLTLTLDMRGVLIPVVALFSKGLTNRSLNLEAEGMKRAAETS
jgi:hypothetical protein